MADAVIIIPAFVGMMFLQSIETRLIRSSFPRRRESSDLRFSGLFAQRDSLKSKARLAAGSLDLRLRGDDTMAKALRYAQNGQEKTRLAAGFLDPRFRGDDVLTKPR